MKNSLIGFAFIFLFASSCKQDYHLPGIYNATDYELKVPAGFPSPFIPAQTKLTQEGIKLGRMLYYDPILSSNGLSCSSCHRQENSFSSPLYITKTGEKISVPAHINLAWSSGYAWNGSIPTLFEVCLLDFGPDFFNTNMPDLVRKLMSHDKYPVLFKQAFNIDDISKLTDDELKLKITYSISQFMTTMVSSESKCDKVYKRQATFTPEEMDGFQTFTTERGDCFHCHDYPLFTSNTFNNTGLDSIPTGGNLGRFLATNIETDKGKFNVPTLRNIELTAPYMHDGRFQTLEDVVEFYNSGVHWTSPNIDPLMTKPAKVYGLNLTQSQKANLVKFLKTLTDTSFVKNQNYSNPF